MSHDSFGSKAILYAAPLLLCLIAFHQRYQAEANDLNPWKGGGFGMFADLPRTHYRVLKITPIGTPDPKNPLLKIYTTPEPKSLAKEAEAVRAMPTLERLQRFVDRLSEASWVLVGIDDGEEMGKYPVLAAEKVYHSRHEPVQIRYVLVEVFQYEFDRATNKLYLPLKENGAPQPLISASNKPISPQALQTIDAGRRQPTSTKGKEPK